MHVEGFELISIPWNTTTLRLVVYKPIEAFNYVSFLSNIFVIVCQDANIEGNVAIVGDFA
jgi:hypothetical protein